MNELDTESLKNVSRRENRTAFARVLVVTVTMSDIEYCEPILLRLSSLMTQTLAPANESAVGTGINWLPPSLPRILQSVCRDSVAHGLVA